MILKAALNLISPVLQMELCYLSSKCHDDWENRILANVCLSHCIYCVRKADFFSFIFLNNVSAAPLCHERSIHSH